MIEKRTIIDQIEVTNDGIVQVRLALLLLEDGQEISKQWHRTAIEPGIDVDAQIAAVNADITKRPGLKAAPVDAEKIPMLKSICALAHTSEVIERHKGLIASRAAD